MPEPILSAESFRIVHIELNSERFNKPLFLLGNRQEAPIVAEVNIFESLKTPYLTGNIVLVDDHDLYRITDIQGTEKIKIIFEMPNQESELLECDFVVVNVEASTKTNETTSTLKLNMIEDIGYYNELQSISKSYQGFGEDIVRNIVRDNLNRTVEVLSKDQSFQKPFRYLVPYTTPLQAVEKVVSKMTTTTGMPFFFYSTIFSKDFYLTDFETILDPLKEPFNRGKPFTYHHDVSKTSDLLTQMTSIIEFSGNHLENTLKLAKRGGIGSNFTHVNATTGKVYENHINMKERMDVLVANKLMEDNHSHVLIDDMFISDPEGIDQRSLGEFNTMNSVKIGANPYPKSGINSLGQQEFDSFDELFEIRKNILNTLAKNVYEIYVPGLAFLGNPDTSVGNKIEIKILTNDDRATTDQKRSGDFLILSKRHVFNVVEKLHTVSLGVSRITNQRNAG
jgi:hypothetical protein